MCAEERFKILPVSRGLILKRCVGVDHEVDLSVSVDLIDGHVADSTCGKGRFPARAGEEISAWCKIGDALREFGGIPPKRGEICNDLIELRQSLFVVY